MKSQLRNLLQKVKKPYSPGCRLHTIVSQFLYTNAFELFVFNNKDNLMKGIKKWLSENNLKSEINLDIAGVVFVAGKDRLVTNEFGDECKIFAAVFFNEEHLTAEVISHEAAHLTFMLERNVIRYVGLYGEDDHSGYSAEERYSYTIGDFVDSIINKCQKAKLKLKWRLDKCQCEDCKKEEKKT